MPTVPPPASPDPEAPHGLPIRRFGRYWLLRLIARGGMGEVYLAATTGIEGAERPCVVKIIRREHAKDSSFLARFLDEARVQAQLQHPGVVQVIEASTDDNGEPFVVVEYVEGRSLGEVRVRLAQVGYRLSWAEAVALGASVAEALAHVHERVDHRGKPLGIVHRDMSPQNVMVGYGGDLKIIDFGTARGQNRRCHTVSGVVFAKPGYVAPEIANGKPGDGRVDLYALGVMLWELAAGRRFLQGDPTEHLALVAKNQRPLPPIAQVIGAPAKLDEIITRLTAFDPDQRYPGARAAVADLASLLSKAPSLPNGERGVRARIAQLMSTLYPSEPTHSRRMFAKLVQMARDIDKKGEASPSQPSPEPPPQADVDDRILPGTNYRVLRKIGQGGMGTVYEAEHVELGRRVALKVLAAEHATSPDYAARFRREARALSRLSHRNLVTLHDFGQATDGRLYCAMEYLEGETLDKLIARERVVPWRKALDLGMQAATALRDAHAVGLVHRDLKPSNLFLCNDGTLKLLDFGVARMPDEAADGADEKHGVALFGTPEYMAPEQVTSAKVDARADLYALGCVLYELCTGRMPFVADNTMALLDAKMNRDPERASVRAPSRELPASVDTLIAHAMARDPERRTASASLMLEEIRAAIEEPERRRARRKRLAMLAVSSGVAFAALLATTALASRFPTHMQRVVSAIVSAPSHLVRPTEVTSAQPLVSSAAPASTPPMHPSVPPRPAQDRPTPPVAPKTADKPMDAADWRDRAEKAAIARDFPMSAQAAREWVKAEPSREARLFLARMLIHLGARQEAVSHLQAVLDAEPDLREARWLLAACQDPAMDPMVEAAVKGKRREASRVARVDR
jgi:serine/threonine protein kinase